ncbi:MAG: protoporphyrinogen oxidase [Bacteroidales bacterium]|nr:protoporphyrinogen oxidase [Bacteroidales bacterium]MCF8377283.1 protoporphyrinogen oxidase [Bacteroidales bacterium]MCF8401413.1 protoporphyrinogen oxidase [Bacteroidales bacterium]
MEEHTKHQAVIIGAGLSGLVTGFYLKRAGVDFRILEKNDRTGGVIRTYREDGFVYESGPNTAVLSQPEVRELFESLGDRCEIELADQEAKRRLVWKNGAWQALPSGLLQGVKTPLFSFRDKLRLLGEPFRKKGSDPHESLAAMVRRRMGESFLNYAVDPFILGIYAGDPEYLVPKYALPKLYNLEQNYGSFIGGAIKKARQEKSERDKKATREVFSVKGGLENLIRALTDAIGEQNILLNAKEISVEAVESGYKINFNQNGESKSLSSVKVVSTVSSHEVPAIFPFLPEKTAATINNLEYARVAEIALGFKKWDGMPLNAFGGLVPYRENRDILGALFLSSFLKDRAPDGGCMITVFTGGFRKPELVSLSDEDMIKLIGREVKNMLQLPEFNPDILRIFRYSHAIPQYGLSSHERLEAVEEAQKTHPGLYIAGNLRDGIGMADRIKQGFELAMEIKGKV